MTRDEPTRPYRMRRRAELQDQTRRRITESAVALHGTLGPSTTSISAVAARAGVRRSTLYRHFPDEAALFDACSRTGRAPTRRRISWSGRRSRAPAERLRVALDELYGYYRATEPMLDNLFRDESLSPLVAERFAALRGYFAAARDDAAARPRAAGRTAAAHAGGDRARDRVPDLEVAGPRTGPHGHGRRGAHVRARRRRALTSAPNVPHHIPCGQLRGARRACGMLTPCLRCGTASRVPGSATRTRSTRSSRAATTTMLDAAQIGDGDAVLDIACGAGNAGLAAAGAWAHPAAWSSPTTRR